jgi:hypothetical protein
MPNQFGGVPPGFSPGNLVPGPPAPPKGGKPSLSRKIIIGQSIVIVLILAVLIAALVIRGNTGSGMGGNVTATVPPKSITVNKQLKCSGCSSMPVLVTVTTITITATNMVWDVTFQDNAGGSSFSILVFTLNRPGLAKVPGALVERGSTLNAQATFDDSATFPYVPVAGERDMLEVTIYASYGGGYVEMMFDSFTFTF